MPGSVSQRPMVRTTTPSTPRTRTVGPQPAPNTHGHGWSMSTTGDPTAEVQEAARPRPLLHPRLVLLDPALDAAGLRRAPAVQGRTLRSRLRVVASTVG